MKGLDQMNRGYCIDAVSKFLLHAVEEHGYPGAWLISANDKKPLRGKKAGEAGEDGALRSADLD